MKSKILLCYLLTLTYFSQPLHSENKQSPGEQTILREWKAGEKVTHASVEQFGIENCFRVSKIDDTLFCRMSGKSFKEGCTTPKEALSYVKVLHYNRIGEICLGEIVCNKSIADDLTAIFKALYRAKYPIERMLLVDEYGANDERSMATNNTSGFNFRYVPGTKKLSNHSRGLAIDINPLYNPYVRKNKHGKILVSPSTGREYVDRTKDFPYKIDHNDLCYKEFKKRGFIWGGDWKTLKDYQHFEKRK